MPNQEKPNVNTVWSSAGESTPVPPEKQARGYVEEIPFYDDFNGHMKQLSEFQKHVNQEGVPVWDALTVYGLGSYAKSPVDFNLYRSKEDDNTGNAPVTSQGVVNGKWVRWSYSLPEVIAELSNTLAGQIAAFAMLAPPAGWLICNGQAVSRAIYSVLFSRIGTTYGAGDGVTTFNVPEMRGETIRALDLGRGVDPGRTLGSFQAGAVGKHKHFLPTSTTDAGNMWTIPDNLWLKCLGNESPAPNDFARTFDSSDTGAFANENRVRNVAFPYFIKF